MNCHRCCSTNGGNSRDEFFNGETCRKRRLEVKEVAAFLMRTTRGHIEWLTLIFLLQTAQRVSQQPCSIYCIRIFTSISFSKPIPIIPTIPHVHIHIHFIT